MEYSEMKEAIRQAVAEAGITEYEIYYAEAESAEVETLLKEADKFTTTKSAGICFRCITDGKMGYASTECMEKEEAYRIVAAAKENAALLEVEEEVFIHDGKEEYPVLEKAERPPAGAKELIKAAVSIQEELFAKGEAVSAGSQSSAGTVAGKIGIYNSKGVDLYDGYRFDIAVSVAILQKESEMYYGFDYALGELKDIETKILSENAYQESAGTIGAKPVKTGRYSVVLKNRQMRALLSHFSTIFSADEAQKGLSLLNGKEGSRIASDTVTIIDDPMFEGGMIRRSFDDEGVAAKKKTVVENGVLNTLLYDLRTAAKAGKTSTGNGTKADYDAPVEVMPTQMYFKPGDCTFGELLNFAGTGLVITQLNGMHAGADTTSGDFSLNASGYYFENGQRCYPVNQITVAGNFYDVLKSIKKAADDMEMGIPHGSTTIGAPSVLIADMSVAGE